MELSDPVAAKAYKVVQRLLKAVTPILQSIADELLAPDQDLNTPAPSVHHQRMDQNTSYPFPPYTNFQAGPVNANTTLDPQLFQEEVPVSTRAHPSDTEFDSEAFLQGSHCGIRSSSFNNSTYAESSHGDHVPISTPFFTSFDQDAPFANLADLWMVGISEPDWPDLSNALDNTGQDFDADMDDTNRPQ